MMEGGAADIDITEAGYTAYVTEFDTDFSNIDGLTAYKVTEATDTYAVLEEVDNATKGTALILHGEQGGYILDESRTGYVVTDGNLFKAGGEMVGDGNTIYALGNKNGVVGFYLVKDGVTVPADKGYLVYSPIAAAKWCQGIHPVRWRGNRS